MLSIVLTTVLISSSLSHFVVAATFPLSVFLFLFISILLILFSSFLSFYLIFSSKDVFPSTKAMQKPSEIYLLSMCLECDYIRMLNDYDYLGGATVNK